MRIVFLDRKTVGELPELEELKTLGEVTFHEYTSPSETRERIENAEIVITNKVVLDADLIQGARELKLICVAATGMNNIDLDAAAKQGVTVRNVSGYASHSVAQTTFAMLFQLMQNLPYYDDYVKSGAYSNSELFTHHGKPFHEIRGKRFGIIGMGNIGRQVSLAAVAFGAEVVYHSTSGRNLEQPFTHLGLDALLETSDVVSVHAPLNEQTRNLIGYDQLKRMKGSAYLINTGRGGIVVEKDLVRALDEELIAGAALDVFSQEPLQPDNPLLQIKNSERLLMIPHIAWASIEARRDLLRGIIRNIKSFF